MRIGWSCEVRSNEWVKVDLDETDLMRLVAEAGADPGALYKVSTATAYTLLSTECERLMVARLVSGYGHNDGGRLAELTARRAQLLAQITATYPAEPAPV